MFDSPAVLTVVDVTPAGETDPDRFNLPFTTEFTLPLSEPLVEIVTLIVPLSPLSALKCPV